MTMIKRIGPFFSNNQLLLFSQLEAFLQYKYFYTFLYLFKIPTSMQSEHNHSSIKITLGQPQKKTAHHTYPLTGIDKNGQINIMRRFSEFDLVRNVMVIRWPGCYIPTLPQKKFLGNDEASFVEVRRQGLILFLNLLKNIPYLWYSEEFQIFLRKSGANLDTQFAKFKQINLNEVITKYKLIFSQCFNKEISKQMTNEIIEFNQYLKKAAGLLQNLQKMAQQAFTARKKCTDKYMNFINVLMPNYESNCMKIYMDDKNVQSLPFVGDGMQSHIPIKQELKQQKNSVIKIYEEIKREKREVEAFEQVIKVKQKFSAQKQRAISKIKDLQIDAAKISSGKASFFSKISIMNKSKEDQLKINNQMIEKVQEQQKNLTLLYQVVTVLLGTSQIKKFKQFRQKAYLNLLKQFFTLQKQQSQVKCKFWNMISKQTKNQEVLQQKIHEKQKLKQFKQHIRTQIDHKMHKQNLTSSQTEHKSPRRLSLKQLVKQQVKRQEQKIQQNKYPALESKVIKVEVQQDSNHVIQE